MGKSSTSVKKGQILNPKGRPVGTKIVPDAVKKYNSVIIAQTISKYITLDIEALQLIIKDTSLPVLDMFIARILATGIQKSDHAKLNFIFERLVGKVADRVDHSSEDGSMSPKTPTVQFYIPVNDREEVK